MDQLGTAKGRRKPSQRWPAGNVPGVVEEGARQGKPDGPAGESRIDASPLIGLLDVAPAVQGDERQQYVFGEQPRE